MVEKQTLIVATVALIFLLVGASVSWLSASHSVGVGFVRRVRRGASRARVSLPRDAVV